MSWRIYRSDHPRYAGYVVGMMTMLGVLNTLDRSIISILVQPIKTDLQLTDTDIGIVMGIGFSLMYAVFALPLARMADTGNRRYILSGILAVWSLATALCGAAQAAWQLVVCRMVMAGAESGQMPVGQSLVGDYVEPARRARAIGWIGAGTAFGGLMGLALGGFLAETFGWRWAFAMVGLPGVALAGVIWLTIREPREGKAQVRGTPSEVLPLGQTVRELFRRRSFVMLTIAVTACTFPSYSVSLWNPAVMMRMFGVPVGQVGLYLGLVAGTAATFGMLLGGYLGQRGASGPRGLTWPMLGMMVAGPLFTSAYFAPSFPVAVALLVVPSVIGGVWYPPLYAALQNSVPPRMRAIAVAVMAFFSSTIGLGLGPTTVGLLSDAFQPAFGDGSLRVALICVANLSFLAALALFLARRTLERDERTGNAWV